MPVAQSPCANGGLSIGSRRRKEAGTLGNAEYGTRNAERRSARLLPRLSENSAVRRAGAQIEADDPPAAQNVEPTTRRLAGWAQAAGWRGAGRAPSLRARSEANAPGRRIAGPTLPGCLLPSAAAGYCTSGKSRPSNSSIFTRSCRASSRCRRVTVSFSSGPFSPSVSKSIVMPNGVPASSCRA